MALVVGLLASGVQPAEAAALKGAFSGAVFGTYANATAGPIAAQLGKSALQNCPCRGTNGEVLSNSVTTASAGPGGSVLSAGLAVGTVYTQKTETTATIEDTSTVNGLNLLNGLITATAIKAVATVNATATTIGTRTTGSTLVDLVINGNPIAADVTANTAIALPGIGRVVLKKVSRTGDAVVDRGITVQMLVVEVTQLNVFNLPVGAQIVVASANSYFTRNEPTAIVNGEAYAAYANAAIGSTLQNKIGKAAYVTLPCRGTDGATLSNNIASLSVNSVLSTGAAVDTAIGGPQLDGSTLARLTSTVSNVSLLNGLITATTITAVAEETYANGVRSRSADGSGFVGLTVAGLPVNVNVAPNTQLPLLGLGHVIINEQIFQAGGKTQVNGLHIFVDTANLLGLPVGSEIVVARAIASATKF